MIRSMLIVTVASLGMWAFGAVTAADKPDAGKEVTVTGTLMCGKCKLKTPGLTECVNALVVKAGDKTVTYMIADKGNEEEYHECGKGEKAGVVVTGVVSEKDGKKWIKPGKVTVQK